MPRCGSVPRKTEEPRRLLRPRHQESDDNGHCGNERLDDDRSMLIGFANKYLNHVASKYLDAAVWSSQALRRDSVDPIDVRKKFFKLAEIATPLSLGHVQWDQYLRITGPTNPAGTGFRSRMPAALGSIIALFGLL